MEYIWNRCATLAYKKGVIREEEEKEVKKVRGLRRW